MILKDSHDLFRVEDKTSKNKLSGIKTISGPRDFWSSFPVSSMSFSTPGNEIVIQLIGFPALTLFNTINLSLKYSTEFDD